MKCDLQVHTYHSFDSLAKPKDIIQVAVKNGINCLAITDHNTIKGVQEIINYARPKSVLIITGNEIKSREGDIMGLNIKETIPSKLSAKETIKMIKNQGGLVVIPHPFANINAFKSKLEDLIVNIDAIEVFNASISAEANKKALKFAKKHNLGFTAGSDAHFANFVGRGYIELPENCSSVQGVMAAIKNKQGQVAGTEYSALEYIIDHSKRAIAKIKNVII